MPIIATRLTSSDKLLAAWLRSALPGDAIEYHRGSLAVDRDERETMLCPQDRLELGVTATRAFCAADQRLVHLFQRRLAPHCFSYLAVRRGRTS